MKTVLIFATALYLPYAMAAVFENEVQDLKKISDEKFTDPEANFKLVFKKIRESYVDKNVSDEELYRAATAGMLATLNSGKEGENWNALFSPTMLREFMIEKTGKLTGIGAILEFDSKTGYARVLNVIPNSAALKAGLEKDDQILSVNSKRFKDKTLAEMTYTIRGPAGESVHLRVLRGDQVMSFNIKRNVVTLPEVDAKEIDSQIGLLTIGYFKEGTASVVEQKLKELGANVKNLKKLIIDLRGNGGGTFNDAIKVAEIFLPKNHVIARTVSRGKREEYKAHQEPWHSEVQIVVLIDNSTASSAEILAAALKDGRRAMTIGETTKGKWNVQSVEELPNKFAIKYSVSKVEAADGKSYDGTGMKADLEIEGPKGPMLQEIQKGSDMAKRLKVDAPLKAAVEVR